ncbi:hypothetical protein ABQF17_08665 [Mycolicibacterium elephantis]
MTWGPEGQAAQPEPQSPAGRPPDVDTGFWLWVIALPLMVTGYLVDVFGSAERHVPFPVAVISVMFVVVLSAVVLTFQILMRHGYRWARTLLTGGGVASVVYMAGSLFTDERHAVAALTYAVCAIVGSVLIIGGAVLLHRKDAQAFFTR